MSEAIPLPSTANLEQYKKQGKDLLKACRSGDAAELRAWGTRMLAPYAQEWPAHVSGELASFIDRMVQRVRAAKIVKLSDAQFFIAREHGFTSWPKFAHHIEARPEFEDAADAIVNGDIEFLKRLLDSKLIQARSTRAHRSTLLHYISANGVEDFRQKTPPNILEIATLLLDRGADVNAESDAYGGHSTPLGLVATSAHPRQARVQLALMELLISRGARIDGDAVHSSLANGCREAAEFFADRGAPLDLLTAAALGRLSEVDRFLENGADVAKADSNGMTALHFAACEGHLDVVKRLLDRGAPLEVRNSFGGTVLGQTVWSAIHDRRPGQLEVIRFLVERGAVVGDDWFTGPDEVASALGRPAGGRDRDAALQRAHELRHRDDRASIEDAVSIYRKHNPSPLEMANALRSLALAQERAGELAQARTTWQEARQLYVRANVPPGIAEAEERIAAIGKAE